MGADLSDGFVLANGKAIELEESLSGDHTSTGFVITSAIAGEGISFGDLCYLKSDGKYWKANATAKATTEGDLVIALETLIANETGRFLKYGYIRDDSWAFTPGAKLYVGESPGGITATKPSDLGGDCVRQIGNAYTATIIAFEQDLTLIEL
jgi:hypothetical protein